MQTASIPAESINWPLGETFSQLFAHPDVAGVLALGSTGTSAFTRNSDIDALLVFFSLSAPLRIVNTWIEGRLAEIYCTTLDALEQVVSSNSPFQDGSEQATILEWIKTGRIYSDKSGRLHHLQSRAESAPLPMLADKPTIHEAWRQIGFNVAQVKRYLTDDDPMSQTVIDLRLLYSVDEVKVHYFSIRQIPWRGEKPAIQYWLSNDPEFLNALRVYFEATDRMNRILCYEQLARMALAPVAELWLEGDTAISLGHGYGTGIELGDIVPDAALKLWQEIITGSKSEP